LRLGFPKDGFRVSVQIYDLFKGIVWRKGSGIVFFEQIGEDGGPCLSKTEMYVLN